MADPFFKVMATRRNRALGVKDRDNPFGGKGFLAHHCIEGFGIDAQAQHVNNFPLPHHGYGHGNDGFFADAPDKKIREHGLAGGDYLPQLRLVAIRRQIGTKAGQCVEYLLPARVADHQSCVHFDPGQGKGGIAVKHRQIVRKKRRGLGQKYCDCFGFGKSLVHFQPEYAGRPDG